MPKQTFYNLSEEKRERIIKATLEEFTEHKYESVLVANISKKADIPVGSFYQYFYDKDDLYLYLFFEMDQKFLAVCEEKGKNYSEMKEYLPGIFSRIEVEFYETWHYVPDDVLRKFYFGEYDNKLFDLFDEKMKQYKKEGRLIDDIDIELIQYLYVTSSFNVYMYCKKKNIVDPEERFKIKKIFYEKIIGNGIFKF